MNFQFTHPMWLYALLVAVPWVIWLTLKSDVQVSKWRRRAAMIIRLIVLVALVLALAGIQWKRPLEGMNVFYLLDRSDSIPSAQQEASRVYFNKSGALKKKVDSAGVIIFGTDASVEFMPNVAVNSEKIYTVVPTERTDIGAAIRLGTAAFSESGQKRLLLMSDGNENMGDAIGAVTAAKSVGVTTDVLPLGVSRGNDVSVQKLGVPSKLKKGQAFEAKIFINSDIAQSAIIRLYRNEQYLGEQKVELAAGKNLFTFPQLLDAPGFYSYDVRVEAQGDVVPQNNRATSFASVQGDPRVLLISVEPEQDKDLAAALRSARLEVKVVGLNGIPNTLAEMQSYDSIFLSNISAGDLGTDLQKLLESAVRDFGVGLVCVGGDQAYAAGGYRGTPLESVLPVNMELDSKKVLPSGAVVLVMHGMEFNNGNQVARDCAIGVLEALGPTDELGVEMWDGTEQWVVPLQKVGDKKAAGKAIAGMNQGDMITFQGVLEKAHEALKKSTANLKHIIVFSDGDPGAPTTQLMNSIANDRITVSSVLISGHSPPDTMIMMADAAKGRFYNVTSPNDLPQIFLKETAVILKSAIYEEPFKLQQRSSSELTRGIGGGEYPMLLGYVATTPKPRAETPLWTDKGDPLLAHWQYGLGRAVAFTSDAKARWSKIWLTWDKYRQFWSQIGQWSLRRLDAADFATEVSVDGGEGVISVEALDEKGNYKNFLNLQTVVVSPKGEKVNVRLEQTGPGHYEARFPTKEVGAYLLNLMDIKDGQLRGSQVVGASLNYSPEFNAPEPNLNLLRRLAEAGGGKILNPTDLNQTAFNHDRHKTFQPRDLWEWLLKLAVILFPLDVGVRRIQLGREEIRRAWNWLRRKIFFWQGIERPVEAEESLGALLARRDVVRSKYTAPVVETRAELFQPTIPVVVQENFAQQTESAPSASPKLAEPGKKPVEESKDEPASTTSRLLEAKKRAQRRKE